MAVGKVILSGISIMLVVGVVLGVVAAVQRTGKDNVELSPKMKALSSFCFFTDQEACHKSLASVNSTDPKMFVAKAILSAEEAVKKFFNFTDSLIVQATNDNRTKMALDDCKEMMDYAVQSLQASFSEVGDGEFRTTNERIADLRTWLSAVISYQQSCLDGFEHEDSMKQIMTNGIVDASKLTAVALSIVTKLAHILPKFGLQLNIPTSRKLLSVEKNGYPSWFSTVDRKLLAKIDNGGMTPNAVVAKDGSGQFKTIAEALAAAPKNSPVRHVIYIKAGIYDEYITVDKKTTNILMYGDGPRKTIVTGHKNFVDGTSTWRTSTFCKFQKTQD